MMDLKKRLKEAATAVVDGGRGLLTGYVKTAQAVFTKPITIQYPEEKKQLPARSRARIILTRSPDGDERCVACYLCSAACPVSCISMESATRDDGRRYAAWFRIDFARCIYCGFCEEACPTLAIQLTSNFEFAATDMMQLVAEKEDLLKGTGGKNQYYDFYAHAGVAEKSAKGTHDDEKPVVDYRTNLP